MTKDWSGNGKSTFITIGASNHTDKEREEHDYSNEGDTILDNCGGSGTTAIAAIREKRHFILFEKDPIYWEKSVKRVEQELRKLTFDF